MNNDKLDYKIRSIQLLNYINDISAGRLITDPFFQRNLVWREIHKKDFIQTILLGYPFPQIFITKGKIDLTKQMSIASIVDGQQRTNAILDFIQNKFSVNEKKFSELSDSEKERFYKYEIAIIELDLDHDDKKVQDIFQRINRTSNSLTNIEKKASEYSFSEYMMIAEFMSSQLAMVGLDSDEEISDDNSNISEIKQNPYIKDLFKNWVKSNPIKNYEKLITSENLFTSNEIAKKVNLMYTLNLMTTYLSGEIYNRNDKVWELAEEYAEIFPEKDLIVDVFEKVASIILALKFKKNSFWYRKANFFTLFNVLARNIEEFTSPDKIAQLEIIEQLKNKLDDFQPTEEYRNAAKEGVNNAKERALRNKELSEFLGLH